MIRQNGKFQKGSRAFCLAILFADVNLADLERLLSIGMIYDKK